MAPTPSLPENGRGSPAHSAGEVKVSNSCGSEVCFGPVAAAALVFLTGVAGAKSIAGACGFWGDGRCWCDGWCYGPDFGGGREVPFGEFGEQATLFVLNLRVECGFAVRYCGGIDLFRLFGGFGGRFRGRVGLCSGGFEAGKDEFQVGTG